MVGDLTPLTEMLGLYRGLAVRGQSGLTAHEALAKDWCENPRKLAVPFLLSVAQFSRYSNDQQSFHEGPLAPDHPETDSTRTADFAGWLKTSETWPVDEAPELAFRYLDRELDCMRTSPGVNLEDGTPSKMALKLDLLLANAGDGTPIVAELKLRKDEDPFTVSFRRWRLLRPRHGRAAGPLEERLRPRCRAPNRRALRRRLRDPLRATPDGKMDSDPRTLAGARRRVARPARGFSARAADRVPPRRAGARRTHVRPLEPVVAIGGGRAGPGRRGSRLPGWSGSSPLDQLVDDVAPVDTCRTTAACAECGRRVVGESNGGSVGCTAQRRSSYSAAVTPAARTLFLQIARCPVMVATLEGEPTRCKSVVLCQTSLDAEGKPSGAGSTIYPIHGSAISRRHRFSSSAQIRLLVGVMTRRRHRLRGRLSPSSTELGSPIIRRLVVPSRRRKRSGKTTRSSIRARRCGTSGRRSPERLHTLV